MIKREHIPDAAITGMKESLPWSDFWSDDDAKDMIAAAINSWEIPWRRPVIGNAVDNAGVYRAVTLPLPQEKNND